MSAVPVILDLLMRSAEIAAAGVAPTAIKGGGLPQGVGNPSLLATSVGGNDQHGLRGGARLVTERVQVTIRADNYADQKALEGLVRAACDGHAGTIAGRAVQDIVSAGTGPDFVNDADTWMGSVDFRVTFRP